MKPARGPAKATVVHFHGNAENMTSHYHFVRWLTRYGYRVVTFDYRGYGRSSGFADRAGTILDGQSVLTSLTRSPLADCLFVVGQSLGGAVAISSIVRVPELELRGLVIDSSFASYKGVARSHAGFLSGLVSDESSPERAIGRISAPQLYFHGENDPVVPFSQGERLFEASESSSKTLVRVDGAGHLRAFRPGSKYRRRLLEFLDRHRAACPQK